MSLRDVSYGEHEKVVGSIKTQRGISFSSIINSSEKTAKREKRQGKHPDSELPEERAAIH